MLFNTLFDLAFGRGVFKNWKYLPVELHVLVKEAQLGVQLLLSEQGEPSKIRNKTGIKVILMQLHLCISTLILHLFGWKIANTT